VLDWALSISVFKKRTYPWESLRNEPRPDALGLAAVI